MPEHGTAIPKALDLIKNQTVLLGNPNSTGCTLRAQGQTVTVSVVEGIHFLLDNISRFTNHPLEQAR